MDEFKASFSGIIYHILLPSLLLPLLLITWFFHSSEFLQHLQSVLLQELVRLPAHSCRDSSQ